ncbi:protein asteroid homolog 1-like [Astatotilapia calliptera]|uniref:protein asteroid homolog 1-like n=1 Tax=Astatotilapia calliptera TaxID=8154 RepID=UPI000E41F7A5|nr:protein asteroid homolog 1-like [Astatotilapia calliptera]
MGILKLEDLIDQIPSLCEEVNIEKTGLIIDGAALYYFLYYYSNLKLDQRCGGDYPGFKDEVCNFFKTLQDCEVTPYVFLDGGSGSDKREHLVSHLKKKLEKAKTVAKTELGCTVRKRYRPNVLPPLVRDVFIEILKEKDIEFKQCLGEADPEIFSAANQNQCAVLSIDTDFCIYDVHKGFLHLKHFEWKRKKDGKIPAKLYTRSKFCEHFKLDPALMPVFASIAGNDCSRLGKEIFANESSSPGQNDIKRLYGMLTFLSKLKLDSCNDSVKREQALQNAVNHVREIEDRSFKLSIQKYVEPTKTDSELPLWVLQKIERGELTTFVINIVDQKTMILPALVEDFSQPSSYTAAYCIRQYFYGLLTGGQMCTEYDRDREEIKDKRVPSILLSSDEQKQLELERLHEAPEDLRRRVFEEALQVQTLDLGNIPDHLKLPVCVTVFWFKRLQHHPKPETVHCLHALLLGFMYHHDSPEANREVEAASTASSPNDGKQEDEFERKMKALKDAAIRRKWQPRVAHAFSQWLCCMRQSLHLNQLLCSPLPEPQCARLYCGPLLHRLADEDTIEEVQKTLRGEKKELYEYLKTISYPKTTGEGPSSEEQVQKTEIEENSDEDSKTNPDNPHIVEKTLLIGDAVLRDVQLETPGTVINCIPGARAGDIKAYLKLLFQNEHRYGKIVIHVGSNDSIFCQSEVTKISIASVCNFAKKMSDTVVFSGPLPYETNDVIYSRMLSLNHWLSAWCSENSVKFLDNWQTFWENPDLIVEDGIHPTLDGAALLSRRLDEFIQNLDKKAELGSVVIETVTP